MFERRQDAQEVFFDRYRQPRWDGSSLADKTIVVHAEQGIGDEILFASCVPDLLPLARRCILVCDPRLERLFARSFPQAAVHGHLRRKDWSPPELPEPFDVQIPAGSLPLHFRSSPASFPRCARFLDVEPGLLAKWCARLAALGSGLKIGVSWRAGGKPLESRKRTIPLEHWREIFAAPHCAIHQLAIWRRQRRHRRGQGPIRRDDSRRRAGRSAYRHRRFRRQDRRARPGDFRRQCDRAYRRSGRHRGLGPAADGPLMAVDDRRRGKPLVCQGTSLPPAEPRRLDAAADPDRPIAARPDHRGRSDAGAIAGASAVPRFDRRRQPARRPRRCSVLELSRHPASLVHADRIGRAPDG